MSTTQSDPNMGARTATGGGTRPNELSGPNATSSTVDDIKEAAQTVSNAVRDQLAEVTADVGHEAEQTASKLKERGSEAIKVYAHAAQVAASDLEDQSPRIAAGLRAAASSVEKLSDNIRSRDVDTLVHEIRDVARSQPALFFGGAVAAGFAFARFMKSSEHARSRQRSGLSSGGKIS